MGRPKGSKWSAEHRQKMQAYYDSIRGKPRPPEVSAKISAARNRPEALKRTSEQSKARWADPAFQEKMREAKKHLVGVPRTEEVRRKVSESNKGKKRSEEFRQYARLRQLGKKDSPETLLRKSQAHRGRKPLPNHRAGHAKGSYCEKGHWVRSTWERTFADTYYRLSVDYEYEPITVKLPSGRGYTPDFYIPAIGAYVELSGWAGPQKMEKVTFFATLHPIVHLNGKAGWREWLENHSLDFLAKHIICNPPKAAMA